MERFGPELMEAIETGDKRLTAVSGGNLKPIDPEFVTQFKEFLAGSDWNDRRFAVAALSGIARNGEAKDAPLARPWLESEDREVRQAAALALARTGSDDDVGRLLELSRRDGGEVFARVALRLSPGPAGAAIALLDSSGAAVALAGARHLYSCAREFSDETLQTLLHHTSEEVRRVGVACALSRHADSELEELLDGYMSAGRYYYNVIFWLDRALLAPPYLRERTRAELAAFAAEERPHALPELSSALRRMMRSVADQVAARSRASA